VQLGLDVAGEIGLGARNWRGVDDGAAARVEIDKVGFECGEFVRFMNRLLVEAAIFALWKVGRKPFESRSSSSILTS
jgi:hypothetical protein